MLIKKILWKMLGRLGMAKDYEYDELTQGEEVDELLMSINAVIKEITTDYIPLKVIEDVEVVNGIVPYTAFKNYFIELRSVKRGGLKLNYKLSIEFIKVFASDGTVTCEYCYNLPELALDDTVEISRRVTDDLIILGALGDYCLHKGRIDEAMAHDRRYRDGLLLAMRDNSNRSVKARGWQE